MHGTSDSAAIPKPTKNNTSTSDCPEAFAKWYCLNGATCFSVKIKDSTLYNCWCPIGFHGLRCEYKYIEGRYHQQQTNIRHDQPAITIDMNYATQGSNNRNQYEASAKAQHQTKEIYSMIIYNIVVVFLIFLIILLAVRTLRKGGLIIKTMGQRVNEGNSSSQPTNNGKINQDCSSIEFGSNKIKRGQSHHQDLSQCAEPQNQELLRQQLENHHHPSQLLWMAPIFTPDHQQRRELV